MQNLPAVMTGIQLIGHGGVENLVYRSDIPVPQPHVGEVLIKVAAAGINNTDINTRIGWYSKSVRLLGRDRPSCSPASREPIAVAISLPSAKVSMQGASASG
jgi:hypothetical protein